MTLGTALGRSSQENYNTRLQFAGGSVGLPRLLITQEPLTIIDTRFKIFIQEKANAFVLDDEDNAILDEQPIGENLQTTDKLYQVINPNTTFVANFSNDRFTIMSENTATGSVILT